MQAHSEQLLAAFAPFFPGAKVIGSYIGGELKIGAGAAIKLINPATAEEFVSYRRCGR